MNKERWKKIITVFCIILAYLLLSDWRLRNYVLFFLLVMGLCATGVKLSKVCEVDMNYGIYFGAAIVMAMALLITENELFVLIFAIGTIFLGMIAMYRICYPGAGGWGYIVHMLRNIFHLVFYNMIRYLEPLEKEPNKREGKMSRRIAFVLTMAVLIIFIGLGRYMGAVMACLLQALWEIGLANLTLIVFSVCLGLAVSFVLYGYIMGLLDNQLQERANYVPKKDLQKDGKPYRDTQVFCNPVSGVWILNVVLLWNILLVVMDIVCYWNPMGLDFENCGKTHFNTGLVPMSIILLVDCLIFGGECCVLAYSRKLMANNEANAEIVNADLLKKCRLRLTMSTLSAAGVCYFVVVRYCKLLYYNGIHDGNRWGLFFILVSGIAIGYFLIYSLKNNGIQHGLHSSVSVVIIFTIVALIWNKMTYPRFNLLIFQSKMEHRDSMYGITEEKDKPRGVSETDINIQYMEKSGIYAIPSLIALLDYDDPYGETGQTVSEAALRGIEGIYAMEFYEYRQDIYDAEGTEKLAVIADCMEDNPAYMIGMRRQCRQSILEYNSRHNVSTRQGGG